MRPVGYAYPTSYIVLFYSLFPNRLNHPLPFQAFRLSVQPLLQDKNGRLALLERRRFDFNMIQCDVIPVLDWSPTP